MHDSVDIYNAIQNQLYWPRCTPYVVWNDNSMEITTEEELRFVCKMISEERYNEINSARREFEEIEENLRKQSATECSDSDTLLSEDDITQEEFYQMGYRREIT